MTISVVKAQESVLYKLDYEDLYNLELLESLEKHNEIYIDKHFRINLRSICFGLH